MKTFLSGAASLALALLASGSFAPPGQEGSRETLEAKVRQLLDLTNASSMGEQVMASMIQNFRQSGLPAEFIDEFERRVDPEELLERIVPIYIAHLDAPTLEAAIAFFGSERGQEFVRAQTAIVQESTEVGMRWGQEMAEDVMDSLGQER